MHNVNVRCCILRGISIPIVPFHFDVSSGPIMRLNRVIPSSSEVAYLRLNHQRKDSAITIDIDIRSGLILGIEIGIHPLFKSFNEMPKINLSQGCCLISAPLNALILSSPVCEVGLSGEWDIYNDNCNWAILKKNLNGVIFGIKEHSDLNIFYEENTYEFAGLQFSI
jgi:hypothetical protein